METRKPIACCEHLRTKTMYYRPDERPGLIHESGSHTPWCLKTQTPIGPDQQDASPSLCQLHRSCFERL